MQKTAGCSNSIHEKARSYICIQTLLFNIADVKNKFLLRGDISRILKESFTEAKINLLCIFKPEAGWHCGKGPEGGL